MLGGRADACCRTSIVTCILNLVQNFSFIYLEYFSVNKVIYYFILQELLDLYVNFKPTINTKFEIKIMSTNSDIENGVDIRGLFRDALTEFWTHFYDYETVGAPFKVPAFRHNFGEHKWSAIALILAHGWKAGRYFPIKLPQHFLNTVPILILKT